MSTDHGTAFATLPHQRLDELEAVPTRVAQPLLRLEAVPDPDEPSPDVDARDEDDEPTRAIALPDVGRAARPSAGDVGPERDDAKTTQVDIGHLGAKPRDGVVFADVLEEHAPPMDDPDTAERAADRGWGPRDVPEELIKTNFLARDGVVPRSQTKGPESVQTTVFVEGDDGAKTTFFETKGLAESGERPKLDRAEPAYETPTSTPALGADQDTRELPRTDPPPARRAGRVWIIAGVCTAVGVLFGTAVGLSAHLGGDASDEAAIAPTREPATEEPREEQAETETAAAEPSPAAEEPAVEEQPEAPAEPSVVEVAEITVDAPAAEPVDHLAVATEALAAGDLARADAALAEARTSGADEVRTGTLGAELAVLRGDGAMATERVRAFVEQHAGVREWVALGRLYEQAERDDEAREAFQSALALSPRDPRAHIGLAGVAVRAASIGDAQEHLDTARDALVETPDDDPRLPARLHVIEGMIALERGRTAEAQREARRARVIDPRSAEAALLLARVAIHRGDDPEPHLREAVEGLAPAPMALGMLAPMTRGAEACDLSGRYLERAPEGFDARANRRIRRGC